MNKTLNRDMMYEKDILQYISENNITHISEISEAVGCSVAHVYDVLRVLKRAGVIEQVKRGNKYRPSEWRIL